MVAGALCDAPALPKQEIFRQLHQAIQHNRHQGCHSGGGMPACQKERQNYSGFLQSLNSRFFINQPFQRHKNSRGI
jgi:hypothetical protein